MMKNLRYLLVLAACLPVASFAHAEGSRFADNQKHISLILMAEESGDSSDSLRIDRERSLVQDTSSADGGRRRKIKEVAKARPQPKPERVGQRPPPDPEMGGGNGNPADRPDGMNGSGRTPAYNPGGRMPGQGGMPGGGGGGGGGGRQGPPGRGR